MVGRRLLVVGGYSGRGAAGSKQLFWVGLATPGPQDVGGRRQGGVDGSRPDEVEGPGVKQDVRHAEVADACKNLTEYGAECGML